MAPVVEKISDELSELGEAPHWDAETQNLYYLDIFGKLIYRYAPATGEFAKATVGSEPVSPIIPVYGSTDKFLLGLGRTLAVVTWDGESDTISDVDVIAEVEPDLDENRFNDGKCDPSGRFWAGTTVGKQEVLGYSIPDSGTLYSLEPNNKIVPHLNPISLANGLAWSSDKTKFYYIDSPTRVIYQFDYDIIKGTISNRKIVFSFDKHNIVGFPDGQTIDADGNLWIAVFNGSSVIKIDPRKKDALLQTVKLPVKQVTSVAFGGSNLDELYVTTGSLKVDGVVPSSPYGALFKVTGLGVKGLPGVSVKL